MKRLVKKAQVDLNDSKFAEIKALIEENNRFEGNIESASKPYYEWKTQIGLSDLIKQMTKDQLESFSDQIAHGATAFTVYRMIDENKFGKGLDQDINQLANEYNKHFKPYSDALEAHSNWLIIQGKEKELERLARKFTVEEINALIDITRGNLKFTLYRAREIVERKSNKNS